jgi:predicted nucleic acid-binding protein
MILVDTNVVIAYERTGDAKLLRQFQIHDAGICGVTRAEVLYGVRRQADRPRIVAALNAFRQVAIPDARWDEVGDNLAALRAAGLQFPFPDVVIATVAIAEGVELWTRDQQFTLMRAVLARLQLY